MSIDESDPNDVDQRLDALVQTHTDLAERCRYQSACRAAQEARRLAKAEHRLIPYLQGTFGVMNHATALLQPDLGRDTALDMIALLEHEDRARQFQPDFPEERYEYFRQRLSSCAYDNFAKAVAHMQGYNSEGMYACINDGLLVCHRTGKLECIKCFREYATDVYEAADDLPMALHNARLGWRHVDPGPHDRRWVGARDEARLLLLEGHLSAALEALRKAWSLRETYHDPYRALMDSMPLLDTLLALTGRWHERNAWFAGVEPDELDLPPTGEFPSGEFQRDKAASVVALCQGDSAQAIALLEPWDARLRKLQCLDEWFKLRLQLIATLRHAGQSARVPGLAKQLEAAARTARDWMTLRRLARVLDPAASPTPLALLSDVTVGPFAVSAASVAVSADVPAAPAEPVAPEAPRPHQERGQFLIQRLQAAQSANDVANVLNDILAIAPAEIVHPDDAAGFLRLIRFALADGARAVDAWRWAEALGKRFPSAAQVLCQYAALGSAITSELPAEDAAFVSAEHLEELFRAGLDLDSQSAQNFALAGAHYLTRENYGEAERCLARAFRLDRTMSYAALRLAEVYNITDRGRDALEALDMCLREGTQDPQVAWQAAVTAYGLEQFETMLTYLDRFDTQAPDALWSHHYRAAALLELERPEAALAAVEIEARVNPDANYAHLVQRAAAIGALDRSTEFRSALKAVVASRLAEVDFLSPNGLARLHRRLWLSVNRLPVNDADRGRYEDFLLAAALAPDDMFHQARTRGGVEPAPGVNFYRCLVQQPLDEKWSAAACCRADEVEWTSHLTVWGVLAPTEDDARDLVLDWQRGGHTQPATVVAVSLQNENYTEVPGVVWQGARGNGADES